MSLRVKAGIDLEELKKYGFKTGKEWADAGERCLEGIGYKYQHEWYALKAAHGAFILYPGTEDEIFYLDEEPSHRDLLYGVGAFKLGPGRKSDFTHIRYYVEKLLKLYRKKEKE